MSASIYGPVPEARKEEAVKRIGASAEILRSKVEHWRQMTPEAFEMEVRLQILWLTTAVNEFHEGCRDAAVVEKRMRKMGGWMR